MDAPTAIIWVYGGDLPIAEVKDALRSEVNHMSFEDDGFTFAEGAVNKEIAGRNVHNSHEFTIPVTIPNSNKSNALEWNELD